MKRAEELVLLAEGLKDEKIEISKKAFVNLVKLLGVEFEDFAGGSRDDIDDECSLAQLYDEIRSEFPQFFDEWDGTTYRE